MNNLTRSYEVALNVDDVKPGERSVIARINTDKVDRYRTVILPMGAELEAYRRNPIVLWEHGADPHRGTMPIGKNVWIKTDERGIIAKTVFKDDAYSQELFKCYQEEWLRGWSVRMVNPKYSPPTAAEIRSRPDLADCETVYRSWELGEYSGTALPGNKDTLTILASRGIWIPDSLRTMTDSQGGLSGGGAAVADDDNPARTKVGIKHATLAEGDLCPEGECDRCDAVRCEAMPKRSAPFVDTDGSSWWVDDNGKRVFSFDSEPLAREALRIMQHGRPMDLSYQIKASVDDVRREAADIAEMSRQMIALYTTGRI